MRSGLKKVTKSVRGRKGMVRRSYWIKAKEGAKSIGRTLWKHKGKIATGFAGAAIATGIYLHKRKVNAAKNAEMSAAMNLADHRVDARNSLRAIGLDPGRSPNPPPRIINPNKIGRFQERIRNSAAHDQKYESDNRVHESDNLRNDRARSNAAPLQLGSGETAKPKRSRKKK